MGIGSLIVCAILQSPVDYDIAYVRAPRYGDAKRTQWQEVDDPVAGEPGTDLMLLHPDGTEEVLVAGGIGAIVDPCVGFDAKSIYFAKFPDQTNLQLPPYTRVTQFATKGSDIFRIDLATRAVTQLTHGEQIPGWQTPNGPGFATFNLSPCEVPGGRIVFTSSRNCYRPVHGYTFPTMQLFAMDLDGKNVEQIGYLNVASGLHPTVLMDGRVAWSSFEIQGLRGNRSWGLWSIWPDGRVWGPLMSAFQFPDSMHWVGQLSDGTVAVTQYYNGNDFGFGTLMAFPATLPPNVIGFGSPDPTKNPRIQQGTYSTGAPVMIGYRFPPYGLRTLTPWTWASDQASPIVNGASVGKVTQPSGAPGNNLLIVWSGGPVNVLNRPTPTPYPDSGIYLHVNLPSSGPGDMKLIKNSPDYNEQQPKAVVPYKSIYGIAQPAEIPWLPNDGSVHPALPAGTPYGLLGTSSLYIRDSAPATSDSNWFYQGSDDGVYSNSDIDKIRIVLQSPNSFTGATNGFSAAGNERLRILGEVQVRKFNSDGTPVLDGHGDPDTSFLCRIPANTPVTFQMLDAKGRTLTMAQTWHQVRPGELRADCRGCHAHSQTGLGFEGTAASKPTYQVPDFTKQKPVDVEWVRDIKPIMDAKCSTCHGGTMPAAGLVTDSTVASKSKYVLPLRSRMSTLLSRSQDHGTPLTDDEDLVLARWIDLGAAISSFDESTHKGWWADENKPCLTVSSPRSVLSSPATKIVVGACDDYSGLSRDSLSIKADFAVSGRAAGTELADLFTESDSVWSLLLDTPVASGTVTALVKDNQGNISRIERSFGTPGPTPLQILQQQLAAVQKQIDGLSAQINDLLKQKAAIQAQIDAMQ